MSNIAVTIKAMAFCIRQPISNHGHCFRVAAKAILLDDFLCMGFRAQGFGDISERKVKYVVGAGYHFCPVFRDECVRCMAVIALSLIHI